VARILLIARNEIYALVSRKSFWFGALGAPVIAFLIYGVIAYINRSQGSEVSPMSGIQEIFDQPEDNRPQGYVDRSGLIPDDLEETTLNRFIAYPDEESARSDLDSGKISAYYVIAEDYIQSGNLDIYTQQFDLISSQGKMSELEWLINRSLLSGNEELQEAIQSPLSGYSEVNISPEQAPVRDRDSEMTFFLPYGVMMLFYISIMGSSGMLLNSVTKEKENRVLEILMVSTHPQDLLLGKMSGLGVVGLFQVFIWIISSFALLQISGQTFNLPPEFMLDPSIMIYGVIFFILGYLVYAALMAGVGAMVPGLREASQATTLIVIPMMIPLFLISGLIQQPNGTLTTILSIFPLTSPTTMMLRLAATPFVPEWQIWLAIVLLIVTAYLTIRSVAGLFRAQTMLSGQPFKFKRFVLALFGR
jgi:ABC-2 type transport system permease protein